MLDRAAFDLGFHAQLGSLSLALPLGTWIALTAAVLALARLIQPFSRTLQGIAGDRLLGHFTSRIIEAANSWLGLARFEDTAMADDLHRAREEGTWAGLKLLQHFAEIALALFTGVTLVVTLFRLHPLVPLLLVLAGPSPGGPG